MTETGPSKIARIPSEQDAVRRQLERILASSIFRASRQLGRFLEFVVAESLAGRGEALKQYTIATSALGRGEDFDPEADPVVRIEARRLRQTLAHYYAGDGKQDPIVIAVPKGHYAATFEQNPDITPRHSAEPVPMRPTADKEVVPGAQGPTIVQLAFSNLSRDPLLDDFADELTEEVASVLSRFDRVRLVGPFDSPVRFLDAQAIQEIGRRHGANFILSTSLQGSAKSVRVLPRLLSCYSARSIWSGNFSLSGDELADMRVREHKITHFVSVVADFYGVATTHWANQALRDPKSIPAHQEALALYRLMCSAGDPEIRENAVQACNRALARWPEDPIANMLLTDLYLTAYANDAAEGTDTLARAEACARRAVASEPALATPHFVMASVHFFKREQRLSLMEFEEAHRLNPYGLDLAAWIGQYYCCLGEWERGIALLRKSLERGLENPLPLAALALDCYRRGDYEGAWVEAGRIHHSFQIWGHVLRAASLGQLGRLDDARRELTQLQRICPDIHGQGRELLRRSINSDELVDHVIEGLDKAARDT